MISGSLFAQDSLTKKEAHKQQRNFLSYKRHWIVEIPLWVPGFAGSFSYGDIDIEGEDGEDPGDGDPGDPGNPPPGGGLGDIFSRLFAKEFYVRYFYMGKVGFENKHILTEFDAFGGAVGGSLKFTLNNKDIVQANFRMINTRLLLGYKVVNANGKRHNFRYTLVAYVGVRAYFTRLYSDLNEVINKLDISPNTYVPIIGVQNQFIWRRWKILAQADIGFLLKRDNYSMHFTNYYYYRAGRFISLKFGWNHLVLKNKGMFLDEEYNVYVSLSGPATGLVFHF